MGDEWHWMWIRKRIEENWDDWIMAVKNMTSKSSIDRLSKQVKKVFQQENRNFHQNLS